MKASSRPVTLLISHYKRWITRKRADQAWVLPLIMTGTLLAGFLLTNGVLNGWERQWNRCMALLINMSLQVRFNSLDYLWVQLSIPADYAWEALQSPIVDIGGGIGSLEMALCKLPRFSALEFIIFDTPGTVETAKEVCHYCSDLVWQFVDVSSYGLLFHLKIKRESTSSPVTFWLTVWRIIRFH